MTTMLEKAITAADAELGRQEMLLTDPLTLRRMMAKRAVRAALQAIREPTIDVHNAGALSDHQAAPPKIVAGEDGALRIEWRCADPSGMFTDMIDAILAEPNP